MFRWLCAIIDLRQISIVRPEFLVGTIIDTLEDKNFTEYHQYPSIRVRLLDLQGQKSTACLVGISHAYTSPPDDMSDFENTLFMCTASENIAVCHRMVHNREYETEKVSVSTAMLIALLRVRSMLAGRRNITGWPILNQPSGPTDIASCLSSGVLEWSVSLACMDRATTILPP